MYFTNRVGILFYVFCLAFLISFSVHSQNKIGIDPEKPLNILSMDQWTGSDGLISNNLTSVIQSSSKFIWITTFNGILRFDGVNFKLFNKKTLPYLSSNAFYKSFEDSKGNLWFLSQSSGIIKYKDNKFHQILTNDNKTLSVRCIEEDKNGVIWVGTNNSGVYTLKDSSLVKVEFDEFNVAHIMDIEVDAAGDIWFATNGNGIFVYSDNKIKNITKEDGLNHNTVNNLLFADGKMYAGTMDGIYFFSKDENKRIKIFDGLEINDMYIDGYDNLWVGSEQGLFKANLQNNSFDRYTEADGLPSSQISSLCFDHENSLWLSTKKAGLIRLRAGSFKNITTDEGLSSKFVNIIVKYNNKMLVGCDDGLINIIDGDKINRFKIKNTFYNVGIRDINIADGGEILVASYRGLLSINNGKEELIDLSKYGASNDVRRILRGTDGTIWLATRSSGVIQFKNKNQVKIYNSSNSLKADYILALEENSNGDIYVGTHSGGLSVIKKDGDVVNYPIEDGKPGILIFNLHILDDNNIWVATNVGIYKFDGEHFKKIRIDENLSAETIFDIIIENDNAWLSLNNGLIRVKLSDMERFTEGKLSRVSGRLFDRYDGMAAQECTGATRMTLTDEGILWIPTLGGVAVLDPKDISENRIEPQVYITDFNTDFVNRDFNTDKSVIVEPGILRYKFNFTSLSYIAPPKVQFKYKLSRIDRDWIDAGTEREAIYTNLSKGDHTFTVIASNNDGVWNEKGASLTFIVEPYFYETTLFYFLLAGILGLLIWGVIIWRVRNVESVNSELRKLNEELDRFVYSASHDLRAPLSSVLGLVEIARLEPEISGKDKCLQMINSSIKKLDRFIADIIDYSRNQRVELQTNKVDIEKEIKEIFSELKYLDANGDISIKIKNLEERHFMTDGRRLIVILKNLISNAFRYYDLNKKNPFIHVEISYAQKRTAIKVADNGIGIDEHHLDKIFDMFYRAHAESKGSGLGLYIVKETVEKLGGEIEVKSRIKQGTTFILSIPSIQ